MIRRISSIDSYRLNIALSKGLYNKRLYKRIHATSIRLKRQRCKQDYIDTIIADMESELI